MAGNTGVQYPRQAGVYVANAKGDVLDLSRMEFHFDIRQHDLTTPNNCVVRVYNLSDGTKAQLQQDFGQENRGQLVVQAGYPSNYGAVFKGDVTFYRSGKANPTDSFLDIQAIDGDLAYSFAVVNQTLEANANGSKEQLDQIQQVYQANGVDEGYLALISQNRLSRAKTLFGLARDYLDEIAATNNLRWSIQQGKLQMTPVGGFLPQAAMPLNSASGLIGIPEVQPDGLHVRALINPAFLPGQLLYINNRDIVNYLLSPGLESLVEAPFLPTAAQLSDGTWTIMVANHTGGTRENSFYTEMICLAPNQPVPPQLWPRLL